MKEINRKIVGCIGVGNMGIALVSNLSKNINSANILCYDIDRTKLDTIQTEFGIRIAGSIKEVTAKSEIILIAVKPDTINSVLKEMKENIEDKIIISIAAGISTDYIIKIIKPSKNVVRVMPNTPAIIGHGMSVISPAKNSSERSVLVAQEIFSCMGKVLVLPEKMLDAVTAVSGCGPAYAFMLIQAMTDGGVKLGITRDKALMLAAQTVYGAAKMILSGLDDPIVLRGKVTSPGGSTIEAVHVLEKAGFSGILMDAIEAAMKKSVEIGKIE